MKDRVDSLEKLLDELLEDEELLDEEDPEELLLFSLSDL